jgi:membrane protease YdiL (CAAX protease family)
MQGALQETVNTVPGEWLDPPVIVAAVAAIAASLWVTAGLVTRWRRREPLVAWRSHEPVPWNGGDVAAVFLAFLLASAVGQEFGGDGASLVRRMGIHVAALALATMFGVAVLRARGATWAGLGFRGEWPEDARLACGTVAFMLAPLLALAGLLDLLVPYRHPLVDLLADRRDGLALATVIASAVIAAPVAEEFFFRRVLQGWLESRFPEPAGTTAIVLSAAAFALAHQGQGLAYVPLFPFGLVLGTLARQTGSIVACIAAHAIFNAISVGIVLLTA